MQRSRRNMRSSYAPLLRKFNILADRIKEYIRMSNNVAQVIMRMTILATALELARLQGVKFAASYLYDEGVAIEVAMEVLAQKCIEIEPAQHIESNTNF